jgi:four helix bundle protein
MGNKIEKFEDILAWQKAQELVILIYGKLRNCKDYAFRDQLQRAAVSIMNNIEEGYERKGNKEFAKFLYIAKGSCGEVRSMLYLALRLDYLQKNKYDSLSNGCLTISRMLSNFIKAIR